MPDSQNSAMARYSKQIYSTPRLIQQDSSPGYPSWFIPLHMCRNEGSGRDPDRAVGSGTATKIPSSHPSTPVDT